jgi:succinate dehydrogenase / fumarate reductase, membrane anchor subunit
MTSRASDLRTPLRRVRHHGAARAGTTHFWHQRLTSVAGISLTIAFIVIVMMVMGRNHAAVVQILGAPLVAILLLLFIVTMVYHMWLGMQEIIIDYVHHELTRYAVLMGNTFFCFVLAMASVFAVLKLSFGV